MTDRMFRLLELHQKLDAAITRRKAGRRVDPGEIALLRKRKLHLRETLARLLAPRPGVAGL